LPGVFYKIVRPLNWTDYLCLYPLRIGLQFSDMEIESQQRS
jgi:hypothetical protein